MHVTTLMIIAALVVVCCSATIGLNNHYDTLEPAPHKRRTEMSMLLSK